MLPINTSLWLYEGLATWVKVRRSKGPRPKLAVKILDKFLTGRRAEEISREEGFSVKH